MKKTVIIFTLLTSIFAYSQKTTTYQSFDTKSAEELLKDAEQFLEREDIINGELYLIVAAQKGSLKAQEKLGALYFNEVRNGDYRRMYYWLTKTAEQGNTKVQTLLAYEYWKEEDVEATENNEKAFYWANKAAQKGNAVAQYILGRMYFLGAVDEKQDLKKALEWTSKSAKQNYARAEYQLGMMFLSGDGVKKDIKRAISLLKRAEKQGHEDASIILKMMKKGRNKK